MRPKVRKPRHYKPWLFVIGGLLALGLGGFLAFWGYGALIRPVSSQQVVWEYDQGSLNWSVKSGVAPACNEPLRLEISPVNMSEVVAVGLPGAYRGFNYKAHGGFRMADKTAGKVDVRLPMDANLRSVSRYYESTPGNPYELQYLADFENDCGIAFRFDHLFTLSPELQAVAEKSPPPKKNDTRRDSESEYISIPIKAGTVIATAVGFPSAQNYGFDFGMYDRRQRNEISNNPTWAQLHKTFSAQDYHGICWVTLLPASDAAAAEAMAKDRDNSNTNKPFHLTSDYCSFAPYRTLDFNDGQPTEG